MMQKCKFWTLVLGITLVFTGCKKEEETRETPITPVKVMTLSNEASIIEGIGYSGTITANKSINISFQVSGTILSIPVEMGDYVKKGQLIALIDDTTYKNQYRALQAQADLAKENYERVLEVYNKGSIAEIRMIEARYQYEQAAAGAKAIYQNMKHTRVYAPISGYVGDKYLTEGDLANPGIPVVQLLDIAIVKADVPIPDNEINEYNSGDEAIVSVSSLNDEKFTGIVDEVSVISNRGNPIYRVKVNIPNPDRRLKPGMACNTYLEKQEDDLASATSQILVPVQTVQVDERGNRFVYLVGENNVAVRKKVVTGDLYDNGIAITQGLKKGDRLIISGYHKITDQSPIKIID